MWLIFLPLWPGGGLCTLGFQNQPIAKGWELPFKLTTCLGLAELRHFLQVGCAHFHSHYGYPSTFSQYFHCFEISAATPNVRVDRIVEQIPLLHLSICRLIILWWWALNDKYWFVRVSAVSLLVILMWFGRDFKGLRSSISRCMVAGGYQRKPGLLSVWD